MTMMEFKEQTKYALPKVVIKTDGYEVPFALYKLEDLLAKLDLATKVMRSCSLYSLSWTIAKQLLVLRSIRNCVKH